MRKIVNKMWNGTMYGSCILMVVVLIGMYAGLVTDPEKYLILSAELGTFVLFWMLLAKNISKYTKKKKNDNAVRKFIRLNALRQREQGIAAFNFYALHVIVAVIVVLNSPLELVRQIISGAAVTIIFIYLIITSIKGVQQKNKGWKASHSIVWMSFPLIMFHIWELEATIPLKYWVMFSILIVSVIVGVSIKMARKRSIRQAKITLSSLIFIALQFVILTIIGAYQDIITNRELSAGTLQEASKQQSNQNKESSVTQEETESNEVVESNEETSEEANTEAISSEESSSEASSNEESSSESTGAYTDGTYQGTGTGYHGGQTTVSVSVADGKIETINIDSIQDTPGFYEQAVQIIPQEIIESQSTNVQTVSGATFTSMGIMSAVDNALLQAQ